MEVLTFCLLSCHTEVSLLREGIRELGEKWEQWEEMLGTFIGDLIVAAKLCP